jgi:hypothetical protein
MTTFLKRTLNGADDGRSTSTPSFTTAGADILGNIGGASYFTFYKFNSVTIPKGSIINSAKLTFKASVTKTADTVRTNISCNDIDTAVAPTDKTGHDAMARTTAFTAWDFTTDWTLGSNYDSADFTSAVQEVINRAGWVTGNALMVFIDDDGSNSGAERRGESYDTDTNNCALLTIDYDYFPKRKGVMNII